MNNLAVVKNETYYQASRRYISDDIREITKNYLRLGFHLHEVEQCEYYKEGGYDNVYDFAYLEFGLSKSSVSRFINICKMFSRNGNSCFLDDKYEKYSCSQLTEMLSMKSSERDKVNPNMSIKEIRDLKRNNLKVVATSQQDNFIDNADEKREHEEIFVATSQQENKCSPLEVTKEEIMPTTIKINKDNYDNMINNYSKEYKYIESYLKKMVTSGYEIEIKFEKEKD